MKRYLKVKLFSKKDNEKSVKQDVIPDIFGDYDIRGIYPGELNEGVFSHLGVAIHNFLKFKKVAIARDSRLSSPALAKSLANSLLALGVNVIDAGMITAPMASWLAHKKKLDTLFVSASHNPPEENGLKIYSRKLGSVNVKNGLKKIEDIFKDLFNKKIEVADASRKGVLTRKDFIGEYQAYLLKIVVRIKLSGRLAIDYSNGTTGLVLSNILDKLGIKFNTLNENPSGAFPGHGPNPLRTENHQKVKWLIGQGRYSFGAIFDGDGDRVAFFDEKGELVSPVYIFALFTDFYLPRLDSAKRAKSSRAKNVVITASFSKIIKEVATSHGGQVFISPVGRTNVSHLMRKKRSLMGAERSGHYFFNEFEYEDNAVLALLKLVHILSVIKKPISKLILPFKKYATQPEINLPFKEGSEKEVLQALRRAFPGGKVSKIDGLTIEYKSWWFNLRVSGTQDLWRLTLEGDSIDVLKEKQAQIEKTVRAVGNIVDRTS